MRPAIERLATAAAPAPGGHYVQAAAWKDLVFTAGQLPVPADGGHAVDRPFGDQARQAIANLLAVLAAAGSGPGDVLKVTVFLAGIEHWPEFNRIFAEAFGEARPARSIVPVPALHHGYLVEIEAVAVRGGAGSGQ